jgi:hypothetical protein
VERGWRDFKGALGLRPVFHHREDRIRGHIQLCWLALLLLRVIENATGDTWRNTRHELNRMHLVTLATNAGHVGQRSTTTPGQETLLRALDLPEPPHLLRPHPRDQQLNARLARHRACSNTRSTGPALIAAAHNHDQQSRVPIICGSPA